MYFTCLNNISPMDLESFMKGLKRRNPGEYEFHQAVMEVAETLIPYINEHPKYAEARILERLTEPDRIIIFRVSWEDDQGNVRVNRGYRVQFNNAIGPYKGGIRFDRSVTLSVLKFLGFEQIFKNSLTSLPLGGAKGGADFHPKGKSDHEIMRFCQAFMIELQRHIGPNTDVPAGDIGVGAREIGYMYGQFKRISNEVTGVLTGKGLSFGGSLIRKEATGYGAVYFAREVLKVHGESLEGMECLVSGSGNVALYCAEKLIELGAKVLTLSDRGGFIYDKEGLTNEKLAYIIDLKTVRRGSLEEFANEFGVEYHKGKRPWSVPCQLAFPCATQNEIEENDAAELTKNGCRMVCEGANMPSNADAVHLFEDKQIWYLPGKAANAGGVAISGLEMSQNALRLNWTREEVDNQLQKIMAGIHDKCLKYGQIDGHVSYLKGANIGGFVKVADSLLDYGII